MDARVRARARIAYSQIPDVPPTKTATSGVEARTEAFVDLTNERATMIVFSQ